MCLFWGSLDRQQDAVMINRNETRRQPLLLQTSLPFTAGLCLLICEWGVQHTASFPCRAAVMLRTNRVVKALCKVKRPGTNVRDYVSMLSNRTCIQNCNVSCACASWLPMLAWAATTSDSIWFSLHYLLNMFSTLLFFLRVIFSILNICVESFSQPRSWKLISPDSPSIANATLFPEVNSISFFC